MMLRFIIEPVILINSWGHLRLNMEKRIKRNKPKTRSNHKNIIIQFQINTTQDIFPAGN